MSDPYQEAFNDVLQKERERKPVWVVGFISQGPGYIGYYYAPLLGILIGKSDNGEDLLVQVPGAATLTAWRRKPDEVFDTKEEAEAHARRKGEDDMKVVRVAAAAFRCMQTNANEN